ncbi:sigma-54 interaction domain-containing protein [Anaeroselena agilis]|uniref:Sigma 54-interacting transcriptional regulator n=1 Tax=Anaeroselena agilis TaxID=3063788 RepID=A0ABU3P323_9FIRM|nr:sigma 54-interacting transcriptional regulator [Selenomonadales bacterium 4137-cl]
MNPTAPKNVLIVSMRKMPATNLAKSLQDIFGKAVNFSIHSYLEQGNLAGSGSPDLILASGEKSYARILDTHPHEKIILAKRDLALPLFFERVFLLPRGKKVLVINETHAGTLDTIQNLINIGIDYLDFKPYWQDCGLPVDSDIDTAISPGMLHICPDNIKIKIDVGMRQLSISVFIRMLNELDLDPGYTEKFISYNKKVLVNAYQRLSEQYLCAETLRLSLESILNNINEAIISVQNFNISECNPAAERLLGLKKAAVLGRNIYDVMGDQFRGYHRRENETDNILFFNNKKLFVTFLPSTETVSNGIFTFKEIREIEKMEESVRKILYKKDNGYTAKYAFKDIVAQTASMHELLGRAESMAQFDETVLITGESGTGKELLAQAIHNASPRRDRPFVAVNFGAIPDNLIESELFGYEEGAFTGAKKSGKKGLFELAHNGTIFLDEIGNSSTWIQSRLLRVLEAKELMRLGDTKVIPVNTRVIVATNKSLKELISQGLFREDLYYRLNVFPLNIPPLRERKGCLGHLLHHFLRTAGINKPITEEAYRLLMDYQWPGNVRELKNLASYLALQSNKDLISVEDLPDDIRIAATCQNVLPQTARDILQELALQFDLPLIFRVLAIFQKNTAGSKVLGRNKMLLLLQSQGIDISDGRLRTIIKHLESHHLIETGKTKQGTIISSAGRLVLGTLETMLGTAL